MVNAWVMMIKLDDDDNSDKYGDDEDDADGG